MENSIQLFDNRANNFLLPIIKASLTQTIVQQSRVTIDTNNPILCNKSTDLVITGTSVQDCSKYAHNSSCLSLLTCCHNFLQFLLLLYVIKKILPTCLSSENILYRVLLLLVKNRINLATDTSTVSVSYRIFSQGGKLETYNTFLQVRMACLQENLNSKKILGDFLLSLSV